MKHPIIIFDGVCNLCNGAVRFIYRRDPHAVFRFANLQSPEGWALVQAHDAQAIINDTFLLIDNDVAYYRSTAALMIAKQLSWPWSRKVTNGVIWVLLRVPKIMRDGVYSAVAKRRYRWFGQSPQCQIPEPELRKRFLPEQD